MLVLEAACGSALSSPHQLIAKPAERAAATLVRGTGSDAYGYGGRRLLEQITGMSHTTILRGCEELVSGLADCPHEHLRVPGGGRPAAEERDPGLERALESLLEFETAESKNAKELSSVDAIYMHNASVAL